MVNEIERTEQKYFLLRPNPYSFFLKFHFQKKTEGGEGSSTLNSFVGM